jgi:endonuclease-3
VANFGGEVPSAMEDLLTLRGTARKTANVVRMHAFGLPGIAVDTHYFRITRRLGLTRATDPVQVEFSTGALLPPYQWTHFANAVILHGRKTCTARAPRCESCALAVHCPSAGQVDRSKELKA